MILSIYKLNTPDSLGLLLVVQAKPKLSSLNICLRRAI
jgi:hypothetical protein